MKKLICFLILPAIIVAMLIPRLMATPTPLFSVTLTTTTNTVTGIQAQPYLQPLQSASITHTGLTNSVNAFYINVYMNAPNSTATNGRVLIGTWYPSTTNAATETINGNNYPYTNYLSFDVISTNTTSVSGSYGQ